MIPEFPYRLLTRADRQPSRDRERADVLSRRELVAAGLAATGAAALPAQTSEPHRVGIVGLGLRSRAHLGALKKLAAGSKIVALCDLEGDRMAKVNATLPARAETYVDYRELLKDRNVGAVVIVTPGYLHPQMVLDALRAGKDVVVEKPLALNYRDAVQIAREARKSGRVVTVGMQRRYAPMDTQVRKLVESGAIGPLRFINYEEYRGDWNAASWKYTDPKTGEKTSWRLLAKTAGSSELEFSVHAFGLVSSLVKSPLARLGSSGAVAHYKGRETRDLVSFVAEFENGVRLGYSFSCFAPRAGGKLVILGDGGTIRHDRSGLTIARGGENPQPVKLEPDSEDGAEVQMYREFFDCVRTRRQSILSPEAVLEPSKIAFASDLSIRENRFVTARDFSMA